MQCIVKIVNPDLEWFLTDCLCIILLWFCFTILFHWFKKLLPLSKPIRCHTKTNNDSVTFELCASFMYFLWFRIGVLCRFCLLWFDWQYYWKPLCDWLQHYCDFPQIQQLEGEMRPLRDGLQSLTSQKDALLAEKTALKNEVWVIKYFVKILTIFQAFRLGN